MNEYTKQVIKKQAGALRAKIAGGLLYGEPIDPNDPDAVLLAVACLYHSVLSIIVDTSSIS